MGITCYRLSERAIIVMLTMNEQETISPAQIDLIREGGCMKTVELTRMIKRATLVAAVLCFATAIASAQKTGPKRAAEAAKHAQEAADAFTEIMNVRERAIPQSLLDRAQAIAVFPNMIKAGFIVGGR